MLKVLGDIDVGATYPSDQGINSVRKKAWMTWVLTLNKRLHLL